MLKVFVNFDYSYQQKKSGVFILKDKHDTPDSVLVSN